APLTLLSFPLLFPVAFAQAPPVAEVFTYASPGCVGSDPHGYGGQYTLDTNGCRDLLPFGNKLDTPFQSLRASPQNEAARTAGCSVEVYPLKNCEGTSKAYPIDSIPSGRNAPCQDVGLTDGQVNLGGFSGKLVCSK
ncbi:MAG: hypothetical protein Q9214_003658, partial [Letrouitia sp. 1 TL-2023]